TRSPSRTTASCRDCTSSARQRPWRCTGVLAGEDGAGRQDAGPRAGVQRSRCLPRDAGCCGFAGDRGFLVPELTASATAREAAEVGESAPGPGVGFYSTCRTCEIGMSRAVGRPYLSLVHLVREALLGG